MNVAALNEKVTFQCQTVVVDQYKNHKSYWADYFTCYATISQDTVAGNDESVGSAVIYPNEKLNFTCRWCSELAAVDKTKYRIVHGMDIYNITSINPMNFRHKSLKFTGARERR